MRKLPHVCGKDIIRALGKANFFIKRQTGSHVIMRHRTDIKRRCIVPVHGSKSIKRGTLHAILKGAQLSVEEFIKLLK